MSSLEVLLLLSVAAEVLTDCTEWEKLCLTDSVCSASYKSLENCSINAVTRYKLAAECQEAALSLQQTPPSPCKCRRRMKKEQQCLKIYWTLHPLETQGSFNLETSPYEDEIVGQTWTANYTQLAALVSDSDLAGDGVNPCVNVARVCSMDKRCSRHRTDYVSSCKGVGAGGSCNRRKCHRYLRHFFKKVPEDFTKRILFCPCQDPSCAERRRKTIVPDCSFEEKTKPNCLQLVDTCRRDPMCRSRLADFQTHCQPLGTSPSSVSCEQNGTCLWSYMRMIGTVMTPNYMSNSSLEVSLWCSCASSGNEQGDCEKLFSMFTSNICLKNAIEAQMRMNKPPLPVLAPFRTFRQQDTDAFSSLLLHKETKKETLPHFEYREASSLNPKLPSSDTATSLSNHSLVRCIALLLMVLLQIYLA